MIFHTPYPLGNTRSGSGVRPLKMYQAFKNLGYEIELISGNSKERYRVFNLLRQKKINEFQFCYSEPSTYPVHPLLDYWFYLFLKRNNIPIGIFYRDAYWKFGEYFQVRNLKQFEILIRHKLDLFIFNSTANTVFFPTEYFSELFSDTLHVNKYILPPGTENKTMTTQLFKRDPIKVIYVGGISKRYGLNILLKALKLINKERLIELELVCRKEEYEKEFENIKPYLDEDWLHIHHCFGHELEDIYNEVSIGLIPLVCDAYNNRAMAVKLFEYLSFGLPIISTDCKEMASFIKEYQCGLICKDDPHSLAESILKLINDKNLFSQCKSNSIKAMKENLWEIRAEEVARVLTQNNL